MQCFLLAHYRYYKRSLLYSQLTFQPFLHNVCKWQIITTFSFWAMNLFTSPCHYPVNANAPSCESLLSLFYIHDDSTMMMNSWQFKCNYAMNQVELPAGDLRKGRMTPSHMTSSQVTKTTLINVDKIKNVRATCEMSLRLSCHAASTDKWYATWPTWVAYRVRSCPIF